MYKSYKYIYIYYYYYYYYYIYIYGEMKHVPNHQPVIVSNGDSEPIPPSGAASTARKSMERLDRATPFSPRNGVAHGRSTIEGRATTNE